MHLKLYVHIPIPARSGVNTINAQHDIREIHFNPSTVVRDALEQIRTQYNLPDDTEHTRYGLFMMNDDNGQFTDEDRYEKGWWLNDESPLDNYLLKAEDNILIKNKIRLLAVKTLDSTQKTHRIDDSKDVKRIVMSVCQKLAIKNPEEYSFCLDPTWDPDQIDSESGMATLVRSTIGRGTLGSTGSQYGTMKSGAGTMKRNKAGDTATLQKKKNIKEQIGNKLIDMANAKYRRYANKLFTDDKIQWLNSSETLRQQGIIHPYQPVILRRKFFYADANVEKQDPVQLNLLYEQCRDSIIKEEYPITRNKASELAGIQATILHGIYDDNKHKDGKFKFELGDMYPEVFLKGNKKTIEKEIRSEWRNISEQSGGQPQDVHALKLQYVKICRSLKTYGITCFLVKEKEKGKNRMVPRLLGISKTSVYRLDNDTKEIIKEWPLESIQRWAAGPKNATLDFGEYQEEPYAVKTKEGEGEKIVQLISGYIDIIMESRRAGDKFDQPGQEEGAIMIYKNQPNRPNVVRMGRNGTKSNINPVNPAIPGVIHSNGVGKQSVTGQMSEAQQVNLVQRPPNKPLRPHLIPFQTTIKDNIDELENLKKKSGQATTPSSTDPDWIKDQKMLKSHAIESHLAQAAAHSAELINKFPSEENLNADQLPNAAKGIVQQLKQAPFPEFASLHFDDPEGSSNIIKAADKLIDAMSNLLQAAQTEDGKSMLETKRKIQNVAHEVSNALEDALGYILDAPQDHYKLVELASNVAQATSELVNNVKTITQKSNNMDNPNAPEKQLVVAATKSAHAATQLVAVARITAPTIHDPACQQQLADAMKDVSVAIKGIFPSDMDKSWLEKDELDKLRDATGKVSEALAALIGHMKRGVAGGKGATHHYDDLLSKTGELASIQDREKLIECVRGISTLAIGPNGLVHSLKSEADDARNTARKERLHMAVRSVMQATTQVVEAAKSVAERNNQQSQDRLAQAAGDLNAATENAIKLQQKRDAVNALVEAVKQAAASSTQLVAPVKVSIKSNDNPVTANKLNIENQALQKSVPNMIKAAREVTDAPDSSSAQQALISATEDFIGPAHKTIAASKTAQPTISDQSAKLMLKNATDKLASALNNLQDAAQTATEVCETTPIETACDIVASCRDDLQKIEDLAHKGQLRPNPGETSESASQNLSTQVKTTCSVVPQLLTCAAQSDDQALNSAAMSAATAVQGLKSAVKSSAATGSKEDAAPTIQAGSSVIASIHDLLMNARDEKSRDSANNRQKLYGVAKDLTVALNNMLNCLPGQKEIESSVQKVKNAAQKLNDEDYQPVGNFKDAAKRLKDSAEDTNQAAGNLVGASRGQVHDVVLAASEYATDYENLVDAGLNVAAHTSGQDRADVVQQMNNVAKASNKLLLASKEIACDLSNQNYRQNLSMAAKDVTDAINDLITKCTAAAPGQASCDAALRKLTYAKDNLLNNVLPIDSKKDYFTILNQIISVHSKKLGETMTAMYQHTREANPDQFNVEVDQAAKTLVELAEDAGHAAYIVSIADPQSIPGREGLLNQQDFTQASNAIFQAIRDLQDENVAQEKLVQAVTVVAKQTGSLCNLCRSAKERAQRPEQRKQFMQAAKDLANATTDLVAKIKSYGAEQTPSNRDAVYQSTIPLDNATKSLVAFSQSPEFASVQPILSDQAKEAQKPILQAGANMLNGGTEMISMLKTLIQNPTNHSGWNSLTSSSRKVSESIKHLIQSIRESAPGQSECDASIDTVNKALRILNDASLDALSDELPKAEGSMASHIDDLVACLNEIDSVSGPLASAAKADATQLGHKVHQTAKYSSPLAESTIAAASLSPPGRQNDLLDHAKTLGEALLQLIYSAKESGGNPNFEAAHTHVDESVDMLREAVQDYKTMLNETPEAATSSLIASIEQSQANLESAHQSDLGQSELHSALFFECRALSKIAQEMSSSNNPSTIPDLTAKVTHTFEALCTVAANAHIIADSKVASNSIKSKTRTCGSSLIDLITAAQMFQDDSDNVQTKRNLHNQCRLVSDAVQSILGILTVSSASAQAAHQLSNKLQSIISDLDTDVLFAQSGNYNNQNDEEAINFNTIMTSVAITAKNLTENIRSLVKGVEFADSPALKETLGATGDSMASLSDAVQVTAKFVAKEGTETQLILLNSVKAVAESLAGLINSTRINSNHQFNPQVIDQLRQLSTGTVFSITKLVKTVQIVRDDQLKGPTALKSTISILQNKSEELSPENISVTSGIPEPEELIAATRPLTFAAGKAVQVGKSCNTVEVIQLCNTSQEAAVSLMNTVIQAASVTDNKELRVKVLHQTDQIIQDFAQLLSNVHDRLVKGDSGIELSMSQYSHRVAGGISELCRSAQKLKGEGWEDPNDPNVIAEKELLNAAAAIEAAAAKLAQLKPRKEATSKANENLNFDEQILEAAKSIAVATKFLVQSASAAQKELVLQGRMTVSGHSMDKSGQFSQGLVSAAQMVAQATGSMCEAANDLVIGEASEEKLEAAARQVSGATSQLLVACKVKADPDSETMHRLDKAGYAVKKASEDLTKAAKDAREAKEDSQVESNFADISHVQRRRKEMEILEEMNRKKRELEEAQRKYANIQRERYLAEGQDSD